MSVSFFNTLYKTDIHRKGHFSGVQDSGELLLTGKVKSILTKGNNRRLILSVQSLRSGDTWQLAGGQVMVIMPRKPLQPDFFAGDIVGGKIYISPIKGPAHSSDFDFKKYWRFQNIYYQSFAESDALQLIHRPAFNLRRTIQELQTAGIARLSAAANSDFSRQIGPAMVLGDKSGLENHVREAFSGAGAMHILAVSGMHLGIIFILIRLLGRFLPDRARLPAELLLIWLYAGVAGAGPSVQRAGLMLTLYTCARSLHRRVQGLQIISMAAFILLWIDPFLLMQVGFQLSCLAVLGIALFYAPIKNSLAISNRIGREIWNLNAVSVAAQLGTLPLSLYYFSRLPVYALLSNLLMTPLASITLFSGMALTVLPPAPLLCFLPEQIYRGSLLLLEKTVTWIATLPGAADFSIQLSLPFLMLLYTAILVLPYLLRQNKKFALYFALLLLLVGTSLLRRENYRQQTRQSLSFYADNKNLCFAGISGRQSYVFTRDSLFPDFLGPELKNEGIRTIEHRILPTSGSGEITRICFPGICFGLAESSDALSHGIKEGLETLVVGQSFEAPEQLSASPHCKTIMLILPMRMSRSRIRAWRELQSSEINVHYLAEEGDLKINIK